MSFIGPVIPSNLKPSQNSQASDSESDGQEEDCQLKPLKISFGSENDSLSKSNVSLTLPKGP